MTAAPSGPEVLLLTAAIDTSAAMRNNRRSDAGLRRADYRAGLSHYIAALPPQVGHIVFCENTGADLTEFEAFREPAAAAGKTLELLGFTGVTPPTLGKGVCEFEILDVAHRRLAERFAPETPVWKITGRLLVRNIAAMIRSRPADAEIYVDMRSVPLIGERLGGNDWAEMRLMCYTVGGYGRLLAGRGESFGYVTEKGLFQRLRAAEAEGARIAPRFRVQPRFRGVCGGSNKDYESLEYRLKDGLRSVTRAVAPGLWL